MQFPLVWEPVWYTQTVYVSALPIIGNTVHSSSVLTWKAYGGGDAFVKTSTVSTLTG